MILGNPPYNAFAGVSPEEENGLVEPYKLGLVTEWRIKKFNLDDLYVRFFRMAEKRVAEHGGRGVVSFISNFSYLGDPSFVVMRRRFLDEFDALWLDCMNGDSRETGKLTPAGKPDPSVFSTEWSREGIRVGTAIGLFVKRARTRKRGPVVRFRHFWGVTKRADLLETLDAKEFNAGYETASPKEQNRWSFRPTDVTSEYLTWPRVVELCAESPSNGLMEKRGGALIDSDRESLVLRMSAYYDPKKSWDEFKVSGHGLAVDAARYSARAARSKILDMEAFDEARLRRYALRPFDNRWCYYSPVRPLWNEPRPTLWKQCWDENSFLLTRFNCAKRDEGVPFFYTPLLSDDHFLTPDAVAVPFRLKCGTGDTGNYLPGLAVQSSITANLSRSARAYLVSLSLSDPDADQETADLIWYHALAIGYSPSYLMENADGIRQDWPRIPLPKAKDALLASAALGRQVAALLDTETPVPGVTAGKIRDDLRTVAVFQRVDGKAANPDAGDLDVTAGWGHAGKGGVTMPGKGKLLQAEGQEPAFDV